MFRSKRRESGRLSRSPEATSRHREYRLSRRQDQPSHASSPEPHRRLHRSHNDGHGEHRSSSRRRRDRRRSRSPDRHHHHHRHRSGSRSPRRQRSKERAKGGRTRRARGLHDRHAGEDSTVHGKDYDSDPLEDFIGPQTSTEEPAVRRRGRGVSRLDSGIDERFSSRYDPALDLHPEAADGDDWELALEAMRDRQRWKQQGAERLRTAGFSEMEVKKWQQDKTEPSTEDVRWKRKGESREWDRGKVVDEDGTIDTAPLW